MKNIKLEIYKRLYKYSIDIVKFTSSLPKNSICYVIGNQLLRSGTSVTANLIEAKAASSKKDYINFYSHSLKSANESKFWLAIIRDTQPTEKNGSILLLKETIEIANIIAASILTMKNKRKI
ncbi:MAG: four helix bundle protein [Candidatus Buchananbacteria bacterium]|nr:four helix bundle protein [Candidatus Buchananbacteria bacterium]